MYSRSYFPQPFFCDDFFPSPVEDGIDQDDVLSESTIRQILQTFESIIYRTGISTRIVFGVPNKEATNHKIFVNTIFVNYSIKYFFSYQFNRKLAIFSYQLLLGDARLPSQVSYELLADHLYHAFKHHDIISHNIQHAKRLLKYHAPGTRDGTAMRPLIQGLMVLRVY